MASGGTGSKTLRVVLLGKTGNGKSSLGNSLTRGCCKQFKVGRGVNSETRYCDWSFGTWDDYNIEVTDTPGLVDTHLPEDVIYKEVGKSVAVASPGPHIFLFVARCDRRFTTEEKAAFETIQQMFPGMEKFLILVFVALDDLHEFPTKELKRQEFAKELSKSGERMTSTLAAAQNKYMAVMNKAKGVTLEESEETIRDLIQMMINLARQNGNSYYTNAVISEIKTEVQKMTDEVSRKQHLTQSQADIKVKQDIVGEEVDPGFLVKVGRAVQNAVTKIKNGAKKIKDACLIM